MNVHKPDYIDRLIISSAEFAIIPKEELTLKSILKEKINSILLMFISSKEVENRATAIGRKFQALEDLKDGFKLDITYEDILRDIKNGITEKDIHELGTRLFKQEDYKKISSDPRFETLMEIKRKFHLNISTKDIIKDLQEGMTGEDIVQLAARLINEEGKTQHALKEESTLPILKIDEKYLALREINRKFNLKHTREEILELLKGGLTEEDIASIGNMLINIENMSEEEMRVLGDSLYTFEETTNPEETKKVRFSDQVETHYYKKDAGEGAEPNVGRVQRLMDVISELGKHLRGE